MQKFCPDFIRQKRSIKPNVMGATKRICELILSRTLERHAVRLGTFWNVLGSMAAA